MKNKKWIHIYRKEYDTLKDFMNKYHGILWRFNPIIIKKIKMIAKENADIRMEMNDEKL